MNERVTITELKYQNKLKLDAAYRNFYLVENVANELKVKIDELYNIVQIGLLPSSVTKLEQTAIIQNDTIKSDWR